MVRAGHSLCGRPFLIVCWGKLNFAVLALGTAEKIMRHPLFASGRAVTVLLAVLFAVVVVSCELPENPHDETSIFGTWIGQYEKYVIEEKDFYNYFGTPTDGWILFYSCSNVMVVPVDKLSGYVYFQFNDEKNLAYGAREGEWYALHYEKLTAESCSIAQAYKAGADLYAENLQEAKESLTVENGYFSSYSELIKSE